ncbi:MAG: purine-nucleoside phosphorylase [Alphaproteobacteria bacterium]|jgi:purine-nucleoside phosphorylase|nr:purine-nucleoside phosphorylase [Alphaproteobacteria bacterium]
MRSESEQAAALIKTRAGDVPINVGLVLGTGLAAIADNLVGPISIPYLELPGFPQPTVGGSDAELIIGTLGTARVAILKGRSNYHETGDIASMRVPLETVKLLGADAVVLVNAAGSTKPEIAPGTLLVIRDHINLSGLNPLIGSDEEGRFVDMSASYDPTMRERFVMAAASVSRKSSEGVYMWFPGPSFETPAEVRAAHMLGADVVGMSLVPEVVIARQIGLRVLAISMVTNFASGVRVEHSERDTMRVAGATMLSLTRILVKFFEIWMVGGPARQ